MKSSFCVDILLSDGSLVSVPVTRKRVRNLNLRVGRDGLPAASVPYGCSEAQARAFLERNRDWLARAIAKKAAQAQAREDAGRLAHAPVSADAGVALWGKAVRAGDIWGDGVVAGWDRKMLEAKRVELYRAEVSRALPTVAARYEAAMGVHAASWQVRSMKSRWGSCTPQKRSIRIALQLAAYPPECLDMVVCHELVHLMEPSHNRRFHMLLDAYCPNNRNINRVLKKPPVA